ASGAVGVGCFVAFVVRDQDDVSPVRHFGRASVRLREPPQVFLLALRNHHSHFAGHGSLLLNLFPGAAEASYAHSVTNRSDCAGRLTRRWMWCARTVGDWGFRSHALIGSVARRDRKSQSPALRTIT